jgi:hypothetical protein
MDTELEKYTNVIYQKIGRNVVLFQQIERILKCLAAASQVSGFADNIPTIWEQQAGTIRRQTMGPVAERFVNNTCTPADDIANEPEETKDAWFSFEFKIHGEGVYERRKERMNAVVAARNELVHHFAPKWDWNSVDALREAGQYLDRQHNEIIPEYMDLQNILERFQKGIKSLNAFIQSDEYKSQLQMFELRQSQPIPLLGNISRQYARADGWTVLAKAVQSLEQNAREGIAILKRQHGFKNLKEAMSATDLFDFYEETTKKGGRRLLYRVKPE